MSEEKVSIFLDYNSIQKEIKISNDYPNLLKSFLDSFNEDKNKIFAFYYYDEENNPIEIDDKYYQTSLDIFKEKSNLIIKVELKNQSKYKIKEDNKEILNDKDIDNKKLEEIKSINSNLYSNLKEEKKRNEELKNDISKIVEEKEILENKKKLLLDELNKSKKFEILAIKEIENLTNNNNSIKDYQKEIKKKLSNFEL